MNLLSSKRGQVGNYVTVIIVLFIFAVFSIFALLLLQAFIANLTTTGFYTGEAAIQGTKFWNALLIMDKLTVLFMTVLIIAVGLTSYRLRTSPAFFIVSFIMGFFLGLISLFFNYMFIQIASQNVVQGVMVFFPWTMIVCTNFHWLALVIWTVGSITLYAKKDRGGPLEAI